MKSRKNILLILSSGGMILSCFYACTSFILACIAQKPIPMTEATVILFLATITTYIHNRRGWRRIYVIGLHVLGLSFAFLRLCHNYYRLESPFWSFPWVSEFLMLERTVTGWFVLVLILLCIGVLWFCGMRLFIKPTDQTTISHRFDSGLGYLLFLLLIKLVIAVKGVSIPVEHSATRPMISFIILGLFSMGIVRSSSASQTAGVTYFKGAGIVLSFTVITLMLGGGLFILFLPRLQTFATASYGLLGTLTRPMEQILIALTRFFFASGIRRKFGEGPTGDLLPVINPSGGELGILHHLFIGIIIAILLAMAIFILYRLLKWLFSTTLEEKDRKGIWERLLLHIQLVKRFLSILWIKIFNNPDTSYAAEKFYKHLLRWGRFSGLSHAVFETPKEYAIRLSSRFPQIEKEIRLIVHLHDQTVYGCILPDGHQISRTRLALRRIRSPSLWFARIKSLCFHNRV
ncbi:MAG: DUF4129 domain-containing protein [Deltaproteobacteria bacterium]|nr:MAG: DUF4129 domain-containing protein [Deltaproteobacteria bacterium]